MTTVRREILIDARPQTAWAAVRDIGALHTRLVPGFVTDVRLEDGARVVTFGNGNVAREVIVSIEDEERRLVWTARDGERITHHNGAAQVFSEGKAGSRFVWTADVLPDEIAETIAAMMDQAMPIIKQTLERAERDARS